VPLFRGCINGRVAPIGRARFSVAHELGHYALGSGAGVVFFGRRGVSERAAKLIVVSIAGRTSGN
jgi:Zn-dependent peptidase ImmA (M78 family)